METIRLTITLDGTETAMLRQAAMRDLRRPRDQARYLLRQALGLATTGDCREMHDRDAMDSEAQRIAVAA